MAKLPKAELQREIKTLIDAFRLEDKAVREFQLRKWKRLSFMWEGFQNVWWDSTAHDWRIYDYQEQDSVSVDSNYYDKQANIFKALLESIIAAISVQIPGVVGVPDDATNVLDMETAEAATKIGELIDKHNNADLLWLHSLFLFYTQGLIAAYNYTDEDEEYGTYVSADYENKSETVQQKICPRCKTNIASTPLSDAERDEFDPDESDVESHDYLNLGENLCPQCLVQVDPELQEQEMIVPRFVGISSKPKARQCVEVYGGLNIKVPNYARSQEDCPYLCFSDELHFSKIIEEYCDESKKDDRDLADQIRNTSSSTDDYERWARLNPQYRGEFPRNTPTLHQWWIRPWAFNAISDETRRNELKKKYPDGIKAVCVNEELICCENEALDDHWTINFNPMTNYLHFEPVGESLVPMQETLNEMFSLVLETVEHGIAQTFADPGVLNFKQYQQLPAAPGLVTPTKSISQSKNVSDGFFQTRTSSLAPEVMTFVQFIQDMAQMVSGALPSLWGGAQPNSSKTASQYSMARAQALQRLQNQWKMFLVWWKEIHGKVIPAFIDNMVEDEQYVQKDDQGNFINVYIRKSELQGKLGSIELEATEQLPLTWEQKKATYMQLLASANPAVQQALTAPENLQLLKDALGIPEFDLPGADQREFQYEEILQLTSSEPINNIQMQPATGPNGQPIMQPNNQQESSVPINDFDDDAVHAEICKSWLVSIAGRQCKTENQKGYLNVLLHWKQHNGRMQQAQMAQMAQAETLNQSKVSPARETTQVNEPPNPEPVMGALRTNLITQ